MAKKAIIIGAGPAGLTAAYELLKRTDIKPVILEKSGDIGGISKTINYKGNRMDIGGHRFFSKSDRVMNWWMNIMPVQQTEEETVTIKYQNKSRTITSAKGASETDANGSAYAEASADKTGNPGKVMLLRKRLSRIYFLRKFFTYPIQLSLDTLRKLGIARTIQILLSYLYAQLVPRKPEKSLEDFMINRFGQKLYLLFFKDYTEKVWGVPCNEISAEWGAQRIKGVSISKAIKHAAQMMVKRKAKASGDIAQKDTETSLIEQFLYPALGPGQLWEEVARQVEVMGGTIIHHQQVKGIETEDGRVSSITALDTVTGEETVYEGDYFFSTMPIKELIAGMNGDVPADVKAVAAGLQYRDFITVGVLLNKLSSTNTQTGETKELNLEDTWIYIQERDVKVGRLQLFNNWSPYMVNRPGDVWIGMEYFCNEGDEFWSLSDEEIKRIAIAELEKMGLSKVEDVLDSTVHRVEKTYPAYFGTYNRFNEIQSFVGQFENLFLVGRNGMHKYNNADHSMLTAMVAVDNIRDGIRNKENIWSINTEQEYHEEKGMNEIAGKVQHEDLESSLSKSKSQEESISFIDLIFKKPENKFFIWVSLIVITLEFLVFKNFYPFPSFINDDSYVYLDAATFNLKINTYPIGYSMFLRLISVFTTSDTFIVGLQYLLLCTSIIGLLFTMFHFYQPRKFVKIILGVFLLANPIFLHLANYVSSDSLFLSLSLIWFTLLIWIIYRPSLKLMLWQGLILFMAFTVRYNALFYPIVGGVAIFLSNQKILYKLIGTFSGIALITLFVIYTSNQYKYQVGVKQFSPFTGWQIVNNAMHAYRFVDIKDLKPVPDKFKDLDKAVRTYIDTTRDFQTHPLELMVLSTIYMWDPRSPFQIYMKQNSGSDTLSKLRMWSKVGPLYEEYGKFLIGAYPSQYFRFYIIPNLYKFYTPPLEFLETYSTGKNVVKPVAQLWFGYKTNKIFTRFTENKINSLNFFPILIGIFNAIFLFAVFSFFFIGTYKKSYSLTLGIVLCSCFWLLNFVFSVLASPIALRFQLFPFIVFFSCSLIIFERVLELAINKFKHTPRWEPIQANLLKSIRQ